MAHKFKFKSALSMKSTPPLGAEEATVTVSEERKDVEELLRQLRDGQRPHDDSPETTTDEMG
jgi:hypothetical protein